MSDGGLGSDIFPESVESHLAISVLIELLEDLGSFLIGHVEATALDDALDFTTCHSAICVQVKAVERCNRVEVRMRG